MHNFRSRFSELNAKLLQQTMLFLTLFVVNTALVGQNFTELISAGDMHYTNGEYEQSAEAYQMALEMEEGSAVQYYNAACSWALSGDTIQSLNYLQQAAEAGWVNLAHLIRDNDLQPLHSIKGWSEVVEVVKANKEDAEKDLNKPLKSTLDDIEVRDQTLRQLLGHAEEKYGRDSKEVKHLWELISLQDSLNLAEVERIIKKHGWLGISEVGKDANTTLWLVIQHAPTETQEKYLPLLRASVLEGESSPSQLAMLEDRILMRQGKPQKYGSQLTRNKTTGEMELYEIFEPQYVNQRRAAVGLKPIEEYIESWGLEWTIEQLEKLVRIALIRHNYWYYPIDFITGKF
ncbi:MAG: hypothetical protein Salg2KO_02640 [Salibacteraceae bacterium]